MLLLTDLTNGPDDKNTGIEYCQKYVKKCHQYPHRYCIRGWLMKYQGGVNMTQIQERSLSLCQPSLMQTNGINQEQHDVNCHTKTVAHNLY